MGGSVVVKIGDFVKIFNRKGMFTEGGSTTDAHTTSERSLDKGGITSFTDRRKIRFKLLRDAREIGGNRMRINMVGHVNDKEGECVGGWIDGKVMSSSERNIRI
jgi:hypothetical protein